VVCGTNASKGLFEGIPVADVPPSATSGATEAAPAPHAPGSTSSSRLEPVEPSKLSVPSSFSTAFSADVGSEQENSSALPISFADPTMQIEPRHVLERLVQSGVACGTATVVAFERSFAQFCGTRHCVGVASGLGAIHVLLLALGVGHGDEVIVPANASAAMALGVVMAGAELVLAEPLEETWHIDPASVEAKMTQRTKAIFGADQYGVPLDYDGLQSIASRRGVVLLADCTHSPGALYKGRRTGSLATASCFSFSPGSDLSAGAEAGAVLTDDEDLARKLRVLCTSAGGSVSRAVEGFNERLDLLQSAVLSAKLSELLPHTAARARVALAYSHAFAKLPWLTLPPAVPPQVESSWSFYVVRCAHRDALKGFLLEHGVECRVHSRTPLHLQLAFRHLGLAGGSFPIAEKLANTGLSLPLASLTEEQVTRVIAAVEAFPASSHWPKE
jgi:dTDP-4-amino-4,6-dideoxygalactose transaminase